MVAFFRRWRRARPEDTAPPQPAPHRDTPPGKVKRRSAGAVYDAARPGGSLAGWRTRHTAPSADLASIPALRDRSRDLVLNNNIGAAISGKSVSYIVGTGVRWSPDTGDEALRSRIVEVIDKWAAHCGVGGRGTFYAKQHEMARAWGDSGEVLARMIPRRVADVRRGVVPLQLQVIEGDHLKLDHIEQLPNGNRIEHGIELSPMGDRVAYHVLRVHPGGAWNLISANPLETVRIPAADMVHLYVPHRPGALRGVPQTAPVMRAVWDLGNYEEAERARATTAASITAIVTGGSPQDAPPAGAFDGLTEPSGDTEFYPVADGCGAPVEEIRPRTILYCPDGKEPKFPQPPGSGDVAPMIYSNKTSIAAGVGMSYEVLSGDVSKANFASAKMGLRDTMRHSTERRRHYLTPDALSPVIERVLDLAVALGMLPDSPEVYRGHWTDPEFIAVDRKAEASADKIELENGTRSRASIIRRSGRDPRTVLDEIEREEERYPAPAAAPAPAPGETP